MRGTIARRSTVAAIAAALLLSGLFVGVSFAGGGGITEPQVLELRTRGCSTNDKTPLTDCAVYPLRDDGGELSGDLARLAGPLWDTDGNLIGRYHVDCLAVRQAGQTCTSILSLKPGPFTESGTIVSTGANGLPPKAITGGSGAYLNVRGEVTSENRQDGFFILVNLIP